MARYFRERAERLLDVFSKGTDKAEFRGMVNFLRAHLDLDQGLVQAFKAVDRRDFAGENYRHMAVYEQVPLEIGHGQTISQPYTVAFMLKFLEAKAGQTVLDVGTGSGWQAALLAHIVGENGKVVSMERVPQLKVFAQGNLAKYSALSERIELVLGNAVTDLKPNVEFDRIVAAASAKETIPSAWIEHLKIGGRIVAPVGRELWLLEKLENSELKLTKFPDFAFVPLVENK